MKRNRKLVRNTKSNDKLVKVLMAVFVMLVIALAFSLLSTKQSSYEYAKMGGYVSATDVPEEIEITAPAEEQIVLFTQPEVSQGPSDTVPQLKIISFNSRPVIPTHGYMVDFILNVKNVGDDAPQTPVEFYADGVLFATTILEPLTRNAAGVVRVEWPAYEQGDYEITAKVLPVPGEIFVNDNVGTLAITAY